MAPTTTPTFSLLHPDIIRAHILPRLDGCTLASVGCVTPELHSLSSDQTLWSHICHSTWPSTTSPRLRQLISTFPDGPRSFFSLSYPPFPSTLSPNLDRPSTSLPDHLISAVDIFYRGKCIFSKIHETETLTGWFRSSPFKIDLLGPKETVATPMMTWPSYENDTCRYLIGDLTLSWIVIDTATRKAVNVSSVKAVSVERHWLTGEVEVKYAVVAGHVMCTVEVTCVGGGGCGDDVVHVTGVSLRVEDVDGVHLNGRDSLVILKNGMEGKRGNNKLREEMGNKKRYLEYMEERRERRERKLRREGRLDMMCVAFGVTIFTALFYLLCSSAYFGRHR